MEKNKRIIGFDLARAYAIFGMYIVNFNIVFGNYYDSSLMGKLLSLFSGNSSTLFVMLAGMGLSLMSNRPAYSPEEKGRLRSIVNKRAWFLFATGLLLFLWWPADILHFYGGYMHIAALLLFLNKRVYLYASALAVIIFHTLLFFIPYETGWNFETLEYRDFWTIRGFIRNSVYNGWNSIFPWLAYFTVGMWLGRLNWSLPKTRIKCFVAGLLMYLAVLILQTIAATAPLSDDLKFYINADYLPPFLPFMISTMGFGFMLIASFMYISKFLADRQWAKNLAQTGQMTLTHYISHLTIGMVAFTLIAGKGFAMRMNAGAALQPWIIFIFAAVYYVLSFCFSWIWLRKFRHGPFEMLMRKISG